MRDQELRNFLSGFFGMHSMKEPCESLLGMSSPTEELGHAREVYRQEAPGGGMNPLRGRETSPPSW